jgi:hypothetical protein
MDPSTGAVITKAMNDIEKVYELLEQIKLAYGITIAALVLVVAILGLMAWKFLNHKIELLTQKSLEKAITEIGIKTKARVERELSAIHNCYAKLQILSSFIRQISGNNKIALQVQSTDPIETLLHLRNDFHAEYSKNRIVFSLNTCGKIDQVLATIDEFIKGQQQAVWLADQVQVVHPPNLKLNSIWKADDMDSIIAKLDQVIHEIEIEFRHLQGA